eukprot:2285-Heterococcus_DN1.PRE.2
MSASSIECAAIASQCYNFRGDASISLLVQQMLATSPRCYHLQLQQWLASNPQRCWLTCGAYRHSRPL